MSGPLPTGFSRRRPENLRNWREVSCRASVARRGTHYFLQLTVPAEIYEGLGWQAGPGYEIGEGRGADIGAWAIVHTGHGPFRAGRTPHGTALTFHIGRTETLDKKPLKLDAAHRLDGKVLVITLPGEFLAGADRPGRPRKAVAAPLLGNGGA